MERRVLCATQLHTHTHTRCSGHTGWTQRDTHTHFRYTIDISSMDRMEHTRRVVIIRRDTSHMNACITLAYDCLARARGTRPAAETKNVKLNGLILCGALVDVDRFSRLPPNNAWRMLNRICVAKRVFLLIHIGEAIKFIHLCQLLLLNHWWVYSLDCTCFMCSRYKPHVGSTLPWPLHFRSIVWYVYF